MRLLYLELTQGHASSYCLTTVSGPRPSDGKYLNYLGDSAFVSIICLNVSLQALDDCTIFQITTVKIWSGQKFRNHGVLCGMLQIIIAC